MSADVCGGCGGPYRFDVSVPSVLWNRVIRSSGGSEYLCLTCIVSAFAAVGESFTAELYGADFNGLPIAVEINGYTATAARELCEQNNALRSTLRTVVDAAATMLDGYCRPALEAS